MMFKKVKNAGKTLKNIGTRSSSRHSSHQSEMSIDPTAPEALSSLSGTRVKVLLKIGDLGNKEKEVFQQPKNKDFIHTPTLDPILLQETGMDTEFDLIFQTVGWTNFWDITELGSRLLTLEFLCTLQYYEGESLFRCSNRTLCCLGEN